MQNRLCEVSYEIISEDKVVYMRVGIDIGGMTIKIGLVNEAFDIIAKKVIPTESEVKTPAQVAESMAQAVKELLQENGLKEADCEGLGIACPGTSDPVAGVVVYSNNIVWENVPLIALMQKALNIPMALANDADAAALGEVLAGAAAGKENVLLLTLGTGVGGGVIINKKIFAGPFRGGCELGHTVIHMGGRPCTCGRKGCLETYASATALMQGARDKAAEYPQSLLNRLCEAQGGKMDGRIIFDAHRQGDATAIQVVDAYEDALCEGIANFINIFRPEVVILGGGVSAQKEYLTDALQDKVNKLCFGGSLGEIPRITTSVLGNDAGIIGAAYLT